MYQQPLSLWRDISPPDTLTRTAQTFQERFAKPLLGADGKLLHPLVKIHGKQFARTAEPGVYVARTLRTYYSLYESKERVDRLAHEAAWADFAQGEWTNDVPREAGLWFALSRDGFQSVKQFVQLPDGTVKDVSGGYVPPGKRTTWLGQWWSKRIPSLRGAK